MNFSILQSQAIKCLNHVIGSTDKKDFLDILSCVKVEIKSNIAKFTTTNLDMQSSDSVEIKSSGDFSFLAPIYSIIEIVKHLPASAEITFTIDDANPNILKISSGKFNFNLSIVPVEDFPSMPATNFEHNIKIKSDKLLECIKKTQFSISNDEVRYNLNGLMLHTEAGKLNFVSTDGHRLSVASTEVSIANDLPNSIIPKRAISEIVKICSNSSDVELDFSTNKVSVKAGNVVFISKLIDGTFPDYKRVIPQSNDKLLTLECAVLAKAVELVSIANMGQENKGVIFTISENGIEISSKVDSCQASEFVSATYTSKEQAVAKYNYKYILDVMSNVGTKSCIFKISSPESPILILPEGNENLRFVVMPMKM
ncbi:DNA polymerase III subunit beta [Candidatus Deianiraea vastatrix]|uniref:Beta sliding clamp n=1 Tax=Candidatus Deianiraea vastatrix TaxID=2163644 RepID=A0A5B8XGD8_9RICK|nr:DNA polymerase III subunit beta [Candidatus Deianiraea vastatrix]QED23915.1 DNA polymerase III subunit beta [Candidatus Deianiraea vastatrix]